jgi:hypothetical protein
LEGATECLTAAFWRNRDTGIIVVDHGVERIGGGLSAEVRP